MDLVDRGLDRERVFVWPLHKAGESAPAAIPRPIPSAQLAALDRPGRAPASARAMRANRTHPSSSTLSRSSLLSTNLRAGAAQSRTVPHAAAVLDSLRAMGRRDTAKLTTHKGIEDSI